MIRVMGASSSMGGAENVKHAFRRTTFGRSNGATSDQGFRSITDASM